MPIVFFGLEWNCEKIEGILVGVGEWGGEVSVWKGKGRGRGGRGLGKTVESSVIDCRRVINNEFRFCWSLSRFP